MRFAMLVASTAVLSGCGGISLFGVNDVSQPACPQIRPYEQGFRDGLAAELERLPTGSPLRVALADYWMLRADAMACSR